MGSSSEGGFPWQFSALQADVVVLKARYEERIRELQKDQDAPSPADFTEQVSLTLLYFSSLSKWIYLELFLFELI